MKFEVEINFSYPGIENESPEMIQQNLQLLLERGADTFNDERSDDWGEEEQCICTGEIKRQRLQMSMVTYYTKTPVPEVYEVPSESQFEELLGIPGMGLDGITYEQFCIASQKSYEKAKRIGFGLTVRSEVCEYRDAEHLEQMKDKLRDYDGFVGFPGDPIIDELQTDIRKLLNKDDESN